VDDSNEEYSNALMAELGNEPETPSEDVQDTSADETVDNSSEGDETLQGASGEDENQDDTSNEAEDEPETPKEPETPQFATKQDIKDAMAEYNQAQTAKIDHVNNLRDEIIQKYYPDGIDQTLRTSDGTEIKTAQDIVDMGLTKPNGEEYTYEEAAQWIMDQRQSISRNLDEIRDNATQVAETNQSLLDGMDRVRAEYGDLLATIPEINAQVTNAYLKTLTIDQERGVVTSAPVDMVDFYRMALAPYKQLSEEIGRRKEVEAELEKRKAVIGRDDRQGLSQRGTSKSKSNTGDAFVDAFIDELGE